MVCDGVCSGVCEVVRTDEFSTMEGQYSFMELADMLMCYGDAKGSTPEALRIYCQKYPRRNVPDRRIFTRLYQRLRDTGSVTGNRFGGRDQRDPQPRREGDAAN